MKIIASTALLLLLTQSSAFGPQHHHHLLLHPHTSSQSTLPPPTSSNNSNNNSSRRSSRNTQLYVFDFFKQRASEGVDQLKNLSTKTSEGKLLEGLSDAATYTSVSNAAFADGLAKSRNRLLYDLESALNGGGNVLDDLEDILLQADLGIATSEDIMNEIQSLRLDSTQLFSKDDLMLFGDP